MFVLRFVGFVLLAVLFGKLLFLATGHHLGLALGLLLVGFLAVRALRFAAWRHRGYAYGCAHGRAREVVRL